MGALNTISSFYDKNGLNKFVSGAGWIEYENGRRLKVNPDKITTQKFLYGLNTIFQQGTFFPAVMFRKIGGFNIQNRTSWDGEFFLNLVYEGFEHIVIKNNIAVFRIHSDSISGSGRSQDQYFLDKSRMFTEKMGRKYGVFDLCLSILLRFFKKIFHVIANIVARINL